jgi:hypothetical protein
VLSKNAVLLPYILTGAWAETCAGALSKIIDSTIAVTDGPVRLFNLTRRNWISNLKIVKVRVAVEVGCYPSETRHVFKDNQWEATGSTTVDG